jgi:uncharacterized SAM-binding protein YcdF (DUF218 family)
MIGGRWRRRLCWAVALVVLLTAAGLFRSWWLPPVGRFLDDSDLPRKTDAIYVLGGGADTRPFVAAALVKRGYSDRVLLPSVHQRDEDRAQGFEPNHEVMRRVLVARGVAPGKITLLPDDCESTEQEAQAVAKFLALHSETTLMVVTSDFHTRRTRMLFRRYLGAHAANVVFVAAPTDGFSPETWWQTAHGFDTYVTEYCKLVSTWLR